MHADIKDETLKQEINDVFSSCYTEETTLSELVDNFVKTFSSNEKMKKYFEDFKFSFLTILKPDEITEPYYQAYDDYSINFVNLNEFKDFLNENENLANLKLGEITYNFSCRYLSFSCLYLF